MKKNVLAACEAYGEAWWGYEEKPALSFIAQITIGSDSYLRLVDGHRLDVCPWVDGYRLKKDIPAQELTSDDYRCEVCSLE